MKMICEVCGEEYAVVHVMGKDLGIKCAQKQAENGGEDVNS